MLRAFLEEEVRFFRLNRDQVTVTPYAWSPNVHRTAHKSVRERVFTFLLCVKRICPSAPKDIRLLLLHEIFGQVSTENLVPQYGPLILQTGMFYEVSSGDRSKKETIQPWFWHKQLQLNNTNNQYELEGPKFLRDTILRFRNFAMCICSGYSRAKLFQQGLLHDDVKNMLVSDEHTMTFLPDRYSFTNQFMMQLMTRAAFIRMRSSFLFALIIVPLTSLIDIYFSFKSLGLSFTGSWFSLIRFVFFSSLTPLLILRHSLQGWISRIFFSWYLSIRPLWLADLERGDVVYVGSFLTFIFINLILFPLDVIRGIQVLSFVSPNPVGCIGAAQIAYRQNGLYAGFKWAIFPLLITTVITPLFVSGFAFVGKKFWTMLDSRKQRHHRRRPLWLSLGLFASAGAAYYMSGFSSWKTLLLVETVHALLMGPGTLWLRRKFLRTGGQAFERCASTTLWISTASLAHAVVHQAQFQVVPAIVTGVRFLVDTLFGFY